MTNFDFIKNMSIEQMADFMCRIAYYEDDTEPRIGFTIDDECKSLRCCEEEIVNWLNSKK